MIRTKLNTCLSYTGIIVSKLNLPFQLIFWNYKAVSPLLFIVNLHNALLDIILPAVSDSLPCSYDAIYKHFLTNYKPFIFSR
jgi:hypothetical protein